MSAPARERNRRHHPVPIPPGEWPADPWDDPDATDAIVVERSARRARWPFRAVVWTVGCLLIVGMVSARTVNLAHIACERPGPTQTASTYRRLQRFFQHVRLERDWALPLRNRRREQPCGSNRDRWCCPDDGNQHIGLCR